jgi:hypothetical protein
MNWILDENQRKRFLNPNYRHRGAMETSASDKPPTEQNEKHRNLG